MEDWKSALGALLAADDVSAKEVTAGEGPAKEEATEKKQTEERKVVERRKRSGVVYSTDASYVYEDDEDEVPVTLPKHQQHLHVSMERAGRGGKTVTLVRGFVGAETDMEQLCKLLKTRCGVGGSVKDGDIIIQGDQRGKIVELLKKEGYK